MAIAVFANKVFEITSKKLHTLTDMQYGTSLNTEAQDNPGKKPSTYNKGPALNSWIFTVKMDASLGVDPRNQIQEWENIKDAGRAYPFILGKKQLGHYKWLLVDVQASNLVVDNIGDILAADVELKFDEYVRPGTAQKTTTTSTSSSPGIKKTSSKVATKSSVAITPLDYKTSYKRNNPAMPKVAGGNGSFGGHLA